jgi:cell division septum initiation protein DivIVA
VAMMNENANRDFVITKRGYERHQVDEHLRDVHSELDGLRTRVTELTEAVSAHELALVASAQPQDSFKALGEETTRILVAAGNAATKMRTDAEGAATETVGTAQSRAARIGAEADDLIATAHRTAAEVAAKADDAAARTKQVAAAAAARLVADAEQRLADASTNAADELAQAEAAASERVAAAESEAAQIRRTADAELATAERSSRERMAAAADQAAATVAEGEARRGDVEAQIDRLRERRRELIAAVRGAIGSTSAALDLVEEEPDPQPFVPVPVSVVPVAVVPVPVPVAVVPVPDVVPAFAPEREPDLKPEREPEPVLADESHAGADKGALEAALAVASVAAGREPTPSSDRDVEPAMLRERSLAGIRPGMLRRLRRGLQELQNGVLEGVRERDGDGDINALLPASEVSSTLSDVARVFLDAGYRAGRADAPVLRGDQPLEDPPTDGARVATASDTLAGELLAELRTTLAPSLRAGVEASEPDASLSERVGEVFRDLKGPVIETVVDRHLTRVYGEATIDGWKASGVTEVEWVLGDESRCPEGMCRANEAEGAIAVGNDFPSGHPVPQVHEGCTCALLPA